jgi:protein-L-isoaspartate(D-aspartate) O-methyltransferase
MVEFYYMNFDQARFNMVEQQIRTWHVLDPKVIEVLLRLKRETFVPLEYQNLAYSDTDVPLVGGKTMPAPCIQARLINDLHLVTTDKVLEIGTGSGYSTAILASLCNRVISIEQDSIMSEVAKSNLQNAGVHNAEVRVGDALEGSASDGPYDAIILQGSVPEIPHHLLEQLQIGGNLIAVVGEDPMMQTCLVTRQGPSSFTHKNLWDTILPRLEGIKEPSHFHF